LHISNGGYKSEAITNENISHNFLVYNRILTSRFEVIMLIR